MVSRLALFQASMTRLGAIPGPGPTITMYRGEIPTDPPLLEVAGAVDPARRVAPYAVVFAGGGNPLVEPDLARTSDELEWPLRGVVAAGYEDDLLDAYDRLHTHLFRWSPVVDGIVCGRYEPPPGYDPAVRRFDQVSPIRFELPFHYRLVANT